MKNSNINALIDLGSNKIKCAVFKHENNLSNLVAFSEKEALGFHNSTIINFEKACNSIRSVVSDIEKKAEINLSKISVLLEPIESITTRFTNLRKMNGAKIEREDINFILRDSKNKIENNDKRLKQIHMFNYKYNIDNKIFKELPSNIYCDKFSIENIFVSIPKNILKNISQVFHSCDLEIDKFISSSYATGLYLFNNSHLNEGCGLVDIGYEKTSVALFKNRSLIKLKTFAIGSNHITKDISKICYLSEIESEKIKVDFVLFEEFFKQKNENELLPAKYFVSSKYRKISLKFIEEIISSRINEIIKMIIKETKYIDEFNIIKKNLLFVGKGSKILDLLEVMKINQENKIFTIANYIDNKDIDSNLLSCISGQNLSIKGWFTEAIATPARDKKIGIFARFFEIFN